MEWQRPAAGIFFSEDNGLLHIHVLRALFPDRPDISEGCWAALNKSIWPDYEPGYGEFLRCAKGALLSNTPSPQARLSLRVIPRCQAWARDTAFTNQNLWPGDFMAHGIKHSEPFNKSMLERLGDFARDVRPNECQSPDWQPSLVKGSLVTVESMRKSFRSLSDVFESGKLRPLYARQDFENCWPQCPVVFQNF